MSRVSLPALPDMDDVEFAARLKPLERSVIPPSGRPYSRISEPPETPSSGVPDSTDSRIATARRLAQIEQIRGPKRRYEYLIPERVGEALAADAARQKKSAAMRLLEILRDAGYPVIAEDFVDLRKEKGKGE
jgi:hypothetical protein